MLTFKKTRIKDLYIIEPTVFKDNRGFFMETYNIKDFEKNNLHYNFVQDNHSFSKKGVLRGLHYQIKYPQAKLVRVIKGEVYDVAVDLRKKSPTFGKYVGVILSEKNKKQFLIPRGFAHGFLVLSKTAEFVYKCDDVYHPGDEGGIMFDDKDINVKWPKCIDRKKYIISRKDTKHGYLKDLVHSKSKKR